LFTLGCAGKRALNALFDRRSNTDHWYAIPGADEEKISLKRPAIDVDDPVSDRCGSNSYTLGMVASASEGIACQPTECPTSRLCRTLTEPRLGVPSRIAVANLIRTGEIRGESQLPSSTSVAPY